MHDGEGTTRGDKLMFQVVSFSCWLSFLANLQGYFLSPRSWIQTASSRPCEISCYI